MSLPAERLAFPVGAAKARLIVLGIASPSDNTAGVFVDTVYAVPVSPVTVNVNDVPAVEPIMSASPVAVRPPPAHL